MAGPSSGAALRVARDVASELGAGKPSSLYYRGGERYLAHPLFDAHREARRRSSG